MSLINSYLKVLHIFERQWDEPTQNPDAFDLNAFVDLLKDLHGIEKFKKMRHNLQPSRFDIYMKNALGDYRGRPDMMNMKTHRGMGLADFEKNLTDLKKKVLFAKKLKPKYAKNYRYADTSKEPATDDTMYDLADSSGDGSSGDGDGN